MERTYRRRRIRQMSAMLFVYATFYICRLAFSASKKDMIEQGAYTAKEIGVVGSAMLIAYAIGKFVNGFIADRVNGSGGGQTPRNACFTGLSAVSTL